MINFYHVNDLEIGAGSISRVGDLIKDLGGTTPLLIVDKFLTSSAMGLDRKVLKILNDHGMQALVYDGIEGEPTSQNVAEGVVAAAKADTIIALGGGSAIDVAKAVAVLSVNPTLSFAKIAEQKALRRLPLVAIPTTSGTGSEATKVSVISNLETGIKENPGHKSFIPDVAILDPELLTSLPPTLTAFTGMDALTHAMEAFVSNKANELSDLYAYKSMNIIGKWLGKAIACGADLEARQQMAIASYLAGIAFSNASTNLAHAGGRALGACFHIPHGLSVALLLPFVMEFGLEENVLEERYAQVAIALGENEAQAKCLLAKQAVKRVYQYNREFYIWQETKKYYIPDNKQLIQAIPQMVKNTLSGNGILTNYRLPTEADVTLIFHKLAKQLNTQF